MSSSAPLRPHFVRRRRRPDTPASARRNEEHTDPGGHQEYTVLDAPASRVPVDNSRVEELPAAADSG